ETFDWDEEEVSNDEEETRVQVLMALADDELSVGKSHARNGEWVDITMKKQIPSQKKKILGGEQLTETSFVSEVKNNSFVPAYLDYDHEMVPKSKDRVQRFNPDSLLPNFNTGKIPVPESQAIKESLQLTKVPTEYESSKESCSEPQTPLPQLNNLQGASPRSEVMNLTYQLHSPRERSGLGTMKQTKPKTKESSKGNILGTVTVSETEPTTPSVPTEVKTNNQESKINELAQLVQMLMGENMKSSQKSQEQSSVPS
ncbi:hypothetical protein Tco_1424273, partial [Tanacetum coccineum]